MRLIFGGKIFLLLFFFLGSCFFFSQTIFAAENGVPENGVQVSPVRFDWDLNSGEERIGMVNLKNYASDAAYSVEISVEDFYVTDDATEARFFIPDAKHPLYAYDVISWIELPANLTLAPNEGRDVFFKVKVPKETPTGGYYGALFFRTKKIINNGISRDSSKVIVNQSVGVLLALAVKGAGPINLSGRLAEIFPEKKIFWNNPVKIFTGTFNDGNLHYKLAGKFEISKFGKTVEVQDFSPRVAYPSKSRNYENSWRFGPWAYGFYRARAELWSEDHEVRLVGETSFWVIPWKTTVAIILLGLIIWFGRLFWEKNFEIKKKNSKD